MNIDKNKKNSAITNKTNKINKIHEIIAGVVLSIFSLEGPMPVVVIPKDMDEASKLTISMKSISLLMGESIYQEGKIFDALKYFGILPFPDLKITALTYFFLIKDEKARGQANASTISLLIDETYTSFIYENMKDLSLFFAETAELITSKTNLQEKKQIIEEFLDKLKKYISNLNAPMSSEHKLKLLFTGLDASGKTSYLRGLKKKYSELSGIKPTRGIERTREIILNREIKEWDIGGQLKYRQNLLKQADLYLYDTNLLNFLIDIRDEKRYSEALKFFGQIIKILRSFKQYPPVIINFHKLDPDIENSSFFKNKIEKLKKKFSKIGKGFKIKFFNTSIFNAYSLNKAFSEGISIMSPNRDILKKQLNWLANEIDAQAVILLNENNIILSDFAKNEVSGRISEISAPYFRNLFRTFTDSKLLKKNNAIWRMDEESVIFYHISVSNNSLYLLSLIKNRANKRDELKVFDKALSEFKKRISTLIETYL